MGNKPSQIHFCPHRVLSAAIPTQRRRPTSIRVARSTWFMTEPRSRATRPNANQASSSRETSTIELVGVGMAQFVRPAGDIINVANALHVTKLGKNLLSPGQRTSTGVNYLLDGDHMTIYAKDGFTRPTGKIIGRIPKGPNNLYLHPATPGTSSIPRSRFHDDADNVSEMMNFAK